MYNNFMFLRKLFLTAFIITCTHSAFAQSNLDFLMRANKDYSAVKIDKVFSADSFRLRDGEKIRLIGLKAPEIEVSKKEELIERDKYGFPIKRPVDPEMPIEEQSFNFAVQLLENQTVRLEFDHDKKDDDFFTYAYVFLEDGTFANAEILRNGFANLKSNPVNKKYINELREAYQEARRELRGFQSF